MMSKPLLAIGIGDFNFVVDPILIADLNPLIHLNFTFKTVWVERLDTEFFVGNNFFILRITLGVDEF